MFFKKKSKQQAACITCAEQISKDFIFCPYCGTQLMDRETELQEFGILGRADAFDQRRQELPLGGITDKIITSLMSSVMKNLDVQVRALEKTEIQNLPHGIKIRVGMQQQKPAKQQIKSKEMTEEQAKKMSALPRTAAKTSVKRLSDKIIYELTVPGLQSANDIFISKLESGYEVKAIGKSKIYVNSLPINLPLKGYSIGEKGLSVEFSLHE